MNKKVLLAIVMALLIVAFVPNKPAGRIGVDSRSFGPFWYADYGNNCRISTEGWMPDPHPNTSGYGFSSILGRWDVWDVCDSDTGAVWEKSHFELELGFLPESLKYGNIELAVSVRPDAGTRISIAAENGAGETLFWWAVDIKVEGSMLST